jgi:hypothetical protein
MVIKKHFQIFLFLFLFIGVLWTGQVFGFWQLKASEIGGDTLIIEVSNKYGIPLETIYETWNIPPHVSPRADLAEARDEAGFSIGRFKIWVTAFVKENNPASAEFAGSDKIETVGDDLNITGAITLQELSYYFGIPRAGINRKFSLPDSLSPNTTVRELREAYDVELGEIKIWLQITSDGLPYYSALKAGELLDPAHIRKWMTIEQVSQAAGMPLDYIYTCADLSSHVEVNITLDELEGITGFTMNDLREAVSEYYLRNPDAKLIMPQTIQQGTPSGTPQDTPSGVQGSRSIEVDGIRGANTIDEVCDYYKIPRIWLLEELALPADTPGNATLRSLELDIGLVKNIVEAYQHNNQ